MTHPKALSLYVCLLFSLPLFAAQPGHAVGEMDADPYADKQITCEEMETMPDKVFGIPGDPDLGSGIGSPIEVDYGCPGGVQGLPFMRELLTLAQDIRGNDFISDPHGMRCRGSLAYALKRYYDFSLLKAGYAPELFLAVFNERIRWNQGLDAELAETYKYKYRENYFLSWGVESPSNYHLWQAFVDTRERARLDLTDYYQTKKGLAADKARAVAEAVIDMITARAAGAFSGSSHPDSETVWLLWPTEVLAAEHPDMAVFEQALQDKPSRAAIDQALKLALARKLPMSFVRQLVDALGEKVDYGNESALFMALDYPEALDLLLARGAALNYANAFGKTPLFYAVERGDRQVVGKLLDKGADPNHPYKTAKELERLLYCEHSIDHTRRTPLMHAAQHSDMAMLELLLAYGARLNDTDELGWNALKYAEQGDTLRGGEAVTERHRINAAFLLGKGAVRAEGKLRQERFQETDSDAPAQETIAPAASFDCAKAGTAAERMICADAGLSTLDALMSGVYKAASKRCGDEDKTQLQSAQLHWLKERNACSDSACIQKKYQTRIKELIASCMSGSAD